MLKIFLKYLTIVIVFSTIIITFSKSFNILSLNYDSNNNSFIFETKQPSNFNIDRLNYTSHNFNLLECSYSGSTLSCFLDKKEFNFEIYNFDLTKEILLLNSVTLNELTETKSFLSELNTQLKIIIANNVSFLFLLIIFYYLIELILTLNINVFNFFSRVNDIEKSKKYRLNLYKSSISIFLPLIVIYSTLILLNHYYSYKGKINYSDMVNYSNISYEKIGSNYKFNNVSTMIADTDTFFKENNDTFNKVSIYIDNYNSPTTSLICNNDTLLTCVKDGLTYSAIVNGDNFYINNLKYDIFLEIEKYHNEPEYKHSFKALEKINSIESSKIFSLVIFVAFLTLLIGPSFLRKVK